MTDLTPEQVAEVERTACDIYANRQAYSTPWDRCDVDRQASFIAEARQWLKPVFDLREELTAATARLERIENEDLEIIQKLYDRLRVARHDLTEAKQIAADGWATAAELRDELGVFAKQLIERLDALDPRFGLTPFVFKTPLSDQSCHMIVDLLMKVYGDKKPYTSIRRLGTVMGMDGADHGVSVSAWQIRNSSGEILSEGLGNPPKTFMGCPIIVDTSLPDNVIQFKARSACDKIARIENVVIHAMGELARDEGTATS